MHPSRTIERLAAALLAALAPALPALAQAADPAGDHQSRWASALWLFAAATVLVALLRLVFGRDGDEAPARRGR